MQRGRETHLEFVAPYGERRFVVAREDADASFNRDCPGRRRRTSSRSPCLEINFYACAELRPAFQGAEPRASRLCPHLVT
jgi:hypothetical protein